MASWTATIGTPNARGLSSTEIRWSPVASDRAGPIDPDLVASAATAYLGEVRLTVISDAALVLLRTARDLVESQSDAGPDLTTTWETGGSLVIAAGGLAFTFDVTEAISSDVAEPYRWQISSLTAMQAFITAYLALPSTVQDTTTITIDDNQPPPDTPDPPAVPTLTVLSNTSIQAVGIAPNDGGRPILSYDWQYRVVGASAWIDRLNQAALTQTFSGLTASTNYEFQFRATNPIGDSAYSSPTATAMTLALPHDIDLSGTITAGSPTLAGALTVTPGTASWTATIGTPNARGLSSTEIRWTPFASERQGPIDPDLVASGATAYFGEVRLTARSGASHVQLRTARDLVESSGDAGPDLTTTWETGGSLVIAAGGLAFTFDVTEAISSDVAEPYRWQISSLTAMQAFITAYLALSSTVQDTTTITIDDNQPPPDTPDAPAAPTLTVLNKNRIQAVGVAPDDGGRPILSYDWQYRVVHASTWIDRLNQAALTQTFSGLTASTNYEFQFRATNPIGDSAYSSPTATAMTPANQAPDVIINTGNMTIAGGATVSLNGTVTDADDATSTLLIAWTSNGGTFVDASLVDTDWTAPARTTQPQTITLTLSATDPDTGFDSATVVMTIPPNIALTGAVTAGSPLLTGVLTVIAQVVLAGALTAASPTLAGALTVTPQVVLNGTITSGSPILTGALTVALPADVDLDGTITSGSPTIAGALTVIPPSDVDLVGTLTAGSPTIAGALTVTAPADVDLSGTITSGNPTLTSALTVTPQVVLNGTITSGSPALTGTLSVVPPADVDLSGTITSGSPTLAGNLRVDALTFADYVVGAGFIVEGAGLIEIGAGTTSLCNTAQRDGGDVAQYCQWLRHRSRH